MAENDESLKHTKIEKTSDHTFNVHTADGGHFECNSPTKLDRLKETTHVKPENGSFAGFGEKTELKCDLCKKEVMSAVGKFDKKLGKVIYVCSECK